MYNVLILSTSFSIENGFPVVELYGKTSENQSIVARFHDYFPYVHIVENSPTFSLTSIEKALSKNKTVLHTESIFLKIDDTERPALKCVLKTPYAVTDLKKQYIDRYDFYNADIDYETKFIYDMNIKTCIAIDGIPSADNRYSCDIVLDVNRFENLDKLFVPSLKYLSLDIENSIKNENILCIGYVTYQDGKFKEGIVVDENEKYILDTFEKIIIAEDPDIITGWHSDGYDLPYISKRNLIHFNTEHMDWTRRNMPMREKTFKLMTKWKCHGRLIVDAWRETKFQLKPKREKLNYVANLLLGESKDAVDSSKIDEEWAKDKEKVLKYCIKDAKLALQILLHLQYIEKSIELAWVAKTPVETVTLMGNSSLIDSVLIRIADRQNYAIPCNKYGSSETKIRGAFVKEPIPGLYKSVAVLDFKSMYPSVMIKNNICFSTISEFGEIVSPIGTKFVSKETREGIIPNLLKTLLETRADAKHKMKQFPNESSEYKYWNGYQDAVKVLMNSFYGVFASNFYRFTNRNIGESVTAFSRENIHSVNKILEGNNISVIYNDTDSVFIQCTETEREDAILSSKEIERRFSEGGYSLELEKFYDKFFIGKRKRYFGRIVWPEIKKDPDIKGYETKRSDSFELQSQSLTTLINFVLDEDLKGAIRFAIGIIDDIRNGKIDSELLCFSKTVGKLNDYKSETLPQIQAAKKMIKYGFEFIPNTKITYIVTNAGNTVQIVEPYLDGMNSNAIPDKEYYVGRMAETLARITTVLGTPEDVLLRGNRQMDLFDYH